MPPPTPIRTFSAVLADQLRRDGSRPLVTFYDDASGERVELSVATYANWVAKTANLLQDELELERGGTVAVDLPPHWLAPVWLGAVWAMGMSVTAGPADAATADLVVCGPDGLRRHERRDVPVVALSLLPMGARFATPLPRGVLDYGVVVWGQPDRFLPIDPPGGDDVAWRDGSTAVTQAELLTAAGSDGRTGSTRLLTDVNPSSRPGAEALLGPLLQGGGTVWVANADAARWTHHAATEQTTAELRLGDPLRRGGAAQAQPPRS